MTDSLGSSDSPNGPARRARPIRVLMVTAMYPTPDRPHSGTFVQSQVESLARVGVEATVLHLRGRARQKYLTGLAAVFRLARSGRFDLIHAHYGYCGLVARAQWRRPLIVSFCGDDLLGTPDRRGTLTPTSRLAIQSSLLLSRLVDGIIVKSEEMRRVLPTSLRGPVEVIPNGVDLARFKPEPRAIARGRLGLAPDRRYVVFPADPAIPRKAFPIVEGAVRLLRDEGVAIDLLPVHGVEQSQVVEYFNAADVVALPSFWEGSPNVVKEAMACNVPIVAADVGDVRVVLGHTPGCAVVERTPSDFAAAIRAAFGLPDGRTNGRERIAPLALPAVAARVRAVYDRVLARTTTGRGGP